jgi:hypothetical protein
MEEREILRDDFTNLKSSSKDKKIGLIFLLVCYFLYLYYDGFFSAPEGIVVYLFSFPILMCIVANRWSKCSKCSSDKVILTDRRIYGVTQGKNFEVSIDTIKEVSIKNSQLVIGTASGQILVTTEKTIQFSREIDKMIKKRCTDNEYVIFNSNNSIGNNPDDLRKFKVLLDDGLITKEEYEQKKKQILGL